MHFHIIMGSDGFQNWINGKTQRLLLHNYSIIIYKRPGFEIENKLNASIQVIECPAS